MVNLSTSLCQQKLLKRNKKRFLSCKLFDITFYHIIVEEKKRKENNESHFLYYFMIFIWTNIFCIINFAQTKKTNKSKTTSENLSVSPMPDLVNGLVELIAPQDDSSFETPGLMIVSTLVQNKDFLQERVMIYWLNKVLI